MLKIGVTGGIGSGKTTVCKIFETLGIPVYYADERAKWLMVNNPDLVQSIINLFGSEAYLPDGALNRAYIAQIVFNDSNLLKELNQLVHPAVQKDSVHWHELQKNVSYTLKEAALLFETGSYKLLDRIITVYAPETVRIARVQKRDNTTVEAIKARMDKQLPDAFKIENADYVIHNYEDHSLIKQVLEIHKELLQL